MRKKLAKKNRVGGFTLLEMLGVMAVMAILASVAVPPMLRSMQNAQSVNEDKNLEEIGRALCEAIKAEGQVPDPGALATATTSGNKGWVAMAAPYCSMASDAIQYVYPGRTETERRFYILTITGPTTQTLSSPTVYRVPATGWDTAGNWPDIMTSFLVLISSSKPDYLLACPVNGSATYTTWASLTGSPGAVRWAKEWVKQAVNGVYSATETQIVDGSWTDKGQFLHVKVIPMNSLICNLTVSLVGYTAVAGDGFCIGLPISYPPSSPYFPASASTKYTTRGSTVNVKAGLNTANATASSSSLDFIYTSPNWRW
jgi:prepilin-type N-terminal cleavage/methylation domain-containing protein